MLLCISLQMSHGIVHMAPRLCLLCLMSCSCLWQCLPTFLTWHVHLCLQLSNNLRNIFVSSCLFWLHVLCSLTWLVCLMENSWKCWLRRCELAWLCCILKVCPFFKNGRFACYSLSIKASLLLGSVSNTSLVARFGLGGKGWVTNCHSDSLMSLGVFKSGLNYVE